MSLPIHNGRKFGKELKYELVKLSRACQIVGHYSLNNTTSIFIILNFYVSFCRKNLTQLWLKNRSHFILISHCRICLYKFIFSCKMAFLTCNFENIIKKSIMRKNFSAEFHKKSRFECIQLYNSNSNVRGKNIQAKTFLKATFHCYTLN